MSPLIPIAVNLLPELAKRLTGQTGAGTIERVETIVRDVLQTADPGEARLAAADPAKAAELRIRLAEIAAQAEAQRDEAAQAQTEARLREFEARLGSQADARGHAAAAAEKGTVYAWGPIVMSSIVTLGFFILLTMLVRGSFVGDQAVLQIVNIGFGTLTAGFATVMSFWLGSSEGSRQKDGLAAALQAQHSRTTQAFLERQAVQTVGLFRAKTEEKSPRQEASADAPRKFRRAIEIVLAQEALAARSATDPRGLVSMGVTLKALAAWQGGDVTSEALRGLSREEATQILRAQVWNALGCQDLPAGLDLAVFDYGVDLGVLAAAKALQSLVGAAADGQIGPVTISAVRQFDTADLLGELMKLRRKVSAHRPASLWRQRHDAIETSANAMLSD